MDLSRYDQATLARWWCDLNGWDWPEDFPAPEPPGWHAMTPKEKRAVPAAREAWEAVNAAVAYDVAHAEWRRRNARTLALLSQCVHQYAMSARPTSRGAKMRSDGDLRR